MKPLRHSSLVDAVPLDDRRGRRTAETTARIAERDRLLREVARRYCAGMSERQAALRLHEAISRYSCSAWRRERADLACPARHAGKLTALCWQLLRVRDHVPTTPTIRRALAAIREPPDRI